MGSKDYGDSSTHNFPNDSLDPVRHPICLRRGYIEYKQWKTSKTIILNVHFEGNTKMKSRFRLPPLNFKNICNECAERCEQSVPDTERAQLPGDGALLFILYEAGEASQSMDRAFKRVAVPQLLRYLP